MTVRILPLLFVFAACAMAQEPTPKPAAQDPKKAELPDAQKVLEEVKQQFQKEGIVFDGKAQTVTVPAVVNRPQDLVEYLLIHKKGKRHEAVFVTKSKPSVLNAALLMLGLMPGKNVSYIEKNPPPTLEEIEKGADPIILTPPKGEPFWMTVKWQTPEGKQEEHCVEDLLMDMSVQKPVANCSWVYLGGRMGALYRNEPEVYIADFEGNLISICYLSPDNHLATMVHDNARDDQNWWTTTLLPPPDTEVQIVYHKTITPMHVERAKRLQKEAAEEKAKADKEPKDGKKKDGAGEKKDGGAK